MNGITYNTEPQLRQLTIRYLCVSHALY